MTTLAFSARSQLKSEPFRLIRCLLLVTLALIGDGCRRTPPGELLRNAAYQGNSTEVNRILAQNAGIVDDPSPSTGVTPLEFAIIAGNQGIVTTLLAHGANVNAYDKLRNNPLYHAVRKGNWHMVQLLIDHGARINDVLFLKENITALMVAAIEGDKSMAEHLLALGADRTARDTEGMTAADYARLNGYMDLAAPLESPATMKAVTRP